MPSEARAHMPMLAATLLLALAQVLHSLDHAYNQERGLEPLSVEVNAVGMIGAVTTLGLFYLVWRRIALAPLACVAVGLSFAIGTVVVHVVPHWSAFSDPYPGLGLDALSWMALAILPVAGLYLAVAGARALRADRSLGAAA